MNSRQGVILAGKIKGLARHLDESLDELPKVLAGRFLTYDSIDTIKGARV